jgi:hypothetical protein
VLPMHAATLADGGASPLLTLALANPRGRSIRYSRTGSLSGKALASCA